MDNMKKNIMWNTFGTLFYTVAQWVITVLVVRISSYEAAGYLGLAMTTSSTYSAISLFGMRNYQISDITGEFTSGEYIGSRLLTCILAMITCAIGAIYGNNIYQILCIDSFMLIRLAEAFVDVIYGEYQKINRYDLIGKSFIFRGIGLIMSFIIFTYLFDNLLLTIILMASISLIIAILYDWRNIKSLLTFKIVFYSDKILNLLKKCTPIVIYGFLLSMQNLFPKNVIQQVYGTTDLGFYTSIASPTLVVQLFASVVFVPFIPKMTAIFDSKKYKLFLKDMKKVYCGFVGLIIVVNIGALLLGRLGLRLIYGPSILEHYNLFMPLVWCTIITGIIWVMCSILIAIRQIKLMLIGMIFDTIINFALTHLLIYKYGMNGASYVQIFTYSLYALYMILLCELSTRKLMRAI